MTRALNAPPIWATKLCDAAPRLYPVWSLHSTGKPEHGIQWLICPFQGGKLRTKYNEEAQNTANATGSDKQEMRVYLLAHLVSAFDNILCARAMFTAQ
jgi:hypothetical protein